MHHQRDPETSYRVEVMWPVKSDNLILNVTTYPPVTEGNPVTVSSVYREDAIPEWMRVALDMLDMAAVGGDALVPFFGSKAGNIYWFHAQQVYGAGLVVPDKKVLT